MPRTALNDDLARLSALLRSCAPIALAFSGGLDSRFLAHAASACLPDKRDLLLFHFQGPHTSGRESAQALRWAADHGLATLVLQTDPLKVREVRANGPLRCYYCKRKLFEDLRQAVAEQSAASGKSFALCDGSNASDYESYRPGLRALQELSIRSPLAEAGLDKPAIRRLAALTGLDRPEQQARPCLLTRFAYGLSPSRDTLAALEQAEDAIADLLNKAMADNRIAAVPDFRLRLCNACEQENSERSGLPLPAELHLETALPSGLHQALLGAISEQGLNITATRVLGRVSGHYDRTGSKAASGGQR